MKKKNRRGVVNVSEVKNIKEIKSKEYSIKELIELGEKNNEVRIAPRLFEKKK